MFASFLKKNLEEDKDDPLDLEPVGFRDRCRILQISCVGALVNYAHGVRRVVDDVPGDCRPDESGSAGDDDAVHKIGERNSYLYVADYSKLNSTEVIPMLLRRLPFYHLETDKIPGLFCLNLFRRNFL